MLGWAAAQALPLTVSATSVVAIASGQSVCGNPGNTNATSLTISNGSGSYTYLWEQIGDPATRGPYTVSSATVATPFWGGDNTCDGDENTESWQLTLTDLIYGQTDTTMITVERRWTNTL